MVCSTRRTGRQRPCCNARPTPEESGRWFGGRWRILPHPVVGCGSVSLYRRHELWKKDAFNTYLVVAASIGYYLLTTEMSRTFWGNLLVCSPKMFHHIECAKPTNPPNLSRENNVVPAVVLRRIETWCWCITRFHAFFGDDGTREGSSLIIDGGIFHVSLVVNFDPLINLEVGRIIY